MNVTPGSFGAVLSGAADDVAASTRGSFQRVGFRFTGKKFGDLHVGESRYQGSRAVEYSVGGVKIVSLEAWRYLFDGSVPAVSSSDRYLEVGASEDGRPDLVAVRAYGLGGQFLWWYLMWVNGLVDFEEVKSGTTLRVPNPPLTTAPVGPEPAEESS